MSLFCGITVTHNSVTESRHAEYQDPEAIIHVMVYTCAKF